MEINSLSGSRILAGLMFEGAIDIGICRLMFQRYWAQQDQGFVDYSSRPKRRKPDPTRRLDFTGYSGA